MPPMFRLIWFAMLDFRIVVRAVLPVWSRNMFQTSRNCGSVNVLIFVYYEMRIPDHIFWSILYISYGIQGQTPTIQVSHIQPPIGRTYDAPHRLEYSRVDPCGQPGTGGARATAVTRPHPSQVAHIQPPIGRAYNAQHRTVYSRVDPCGQPGPRLAICGQPGPRLAVCGQPGLRLAV